MGSDRRINLKLPGGFSKGFLRDLLEALPPETESFKARYLREEIFSKYLDEHKTPAKVRARAAVAKWQAVELRNAKTNMRLMHASGHDFGWTTWELFVSRVRSLVRGVIGDGPRDGLYDEPILTNGAATGVPRSEVTALAKLSGTMQITESALKDWYLAASIREGGIHIPTKTRAQLSNRPLELTENSAMFTVPKKSDIDRVACKEPPCNMLLQRACGEFIRRRLRRVGIDLLDQSRNRDLARKASMGLLPLSTVDLSSASDTISTQLVIELLPFEWYSILDDLRVKSTRITAAIHPDGVETYHSFNMFSAMGNGFTFELESLLFWAIAKAVVQLSGKQGIVSVYGDDILLPCEVTPRLIRIFRFLGFTANVSKTFHKGPFRESCGGHYYAGFDVTPFYVKREVTTLPDLILILNKVLKWDACGWGKHFLTPALQAFHKKYSMYVPQSLWGGIDPSDASALVTGHPPRGRLVAVRKCLKKGYTQEAACLYWMLSRARSGNREVTVDPRKEIGVQVRPFISGGERTPWQPYLIDW